MAGKGPDRRAPAVVSSEADELTAKVRRFFEINAIRKAAEKEEGELKTWFRSRAKNKRKDFKVEDFVVSLTPKSRQVWDNAALAKKLGDELAAFKKASTSLEVTIRRVDDAKGNDSG